MYADVKETHSGAARRLQSKLRKAGGAVVEHRVLSILSRAGDATARPSSYQNDPTAPQRARLSPPSDNQSHHYLQNVSGSLLHQLRVSGQTTTISGPSSSTLPVPNPTIQYLL